MTTRWACFALLALLPTAVYGQNGTHDGQRDFDFEIGAWQATVSRLQRPLSGSKDWVEYRGTSVVRKVWDGDANLGELDIAGPAGRIRGLSLRTYNPQTREWHIHWASSRDGEVGPPMIGGFGNGRGEFYGREFLDGRAIYVRFIFSKMQADSFQIEQAFSVDGGRSWEPNWVAKFTRDGS